MQRREDEGVFQLAALEIIRLLNKHHDHLFIYLLLLMII